MSSLVWGLVATVAFASVVCGVAHAVKRTAVTRQLALTVMLATWLGVVTELIFMLLATLAVGAGAAPKEKATILAAAISEGLRSAAPALLATPPWLLGFLVGELRRRRAR